MRQQRMAATKAATVVEVTATVKVRLRESTLVGYAFIRFFFFLLLLLHPLSFLARKKTDFHPRISQGRRGETYLRVAKGAEATRVEEDNPNRCV